VLIIDFGLKLAPKLQLRMRGRRRTQWTSNRDGRRRGFKNQGARAKWYAQYKIKGIFVRFANFRGVPRTTWRCRKKHSER